MNTERTTVTGMLPEQQTGAQVQARRARRRAIVAVVPKAWLALMAALTMVVLEGAFRKWASPFEEGIGRNLMYFSKDIIFACLVFFPRRGQPSNALRVFENWLWPGCILVALGSLVSSLHSLNPVGALLTARATILLPILALLAAPRLAGLPLRHVALLLALFTVLNFALGGEQNHLPPDNILNRYSQANADVVAAEDYGVRATGTFSYITGMSIISSVGIWAGLVLMGLAQKQWQRIAAWVTLAAAVGCGLASVSRAPIVVGLAMAVGWLFLSRQNLSSLTRGLVAGSFCVIVATGIGITPVFSELGVGLAQRVETSPDAFNERAFGQFGEIVAVSQMAPLGNGFGAHQVGGYFAAKGDMDLETIESPLPRMILETGVVGLIGYLVVCAGALLALQRAKREAQTVGMRAALLATQILLLPMFYGNLIFDHTASAFVWMIFTAVMAAGEMATKADTLEVKGKIGRPQAREWRPEQAPHSVTARQKVEDAA